MTHLRYLAQQFLLLLLTFVAAKPLFLLFNGGAAHPYAFGDVISVMWHGLPLDVATTGYAVIPYYLLLSIGIWVKLPLKCLNIYYRVVNTLLAVLLALIFVADTVLYSFWEFKLDGTAEEALRQIKDKDYQLQFFADSLAHVDGQGGAKHTYIVGVNFSKETRTIDKWLVE